MSAENTAPYGLVRDAAIVVQEGRISWVGPAKNCPPMFSQAASNDFGDRLVTPSFVDCHTHIISGGNRAQEFEMRLNGASYEDVARAGGGIVSTVSATREASLEALVSDALPRIDAMIAEGTSLVEVKSGYGLDVETELKMLRAAKRLAELRSIRIVRTFLGAHAVPPEFASEPNQYIDEV
ncbi:imidazolonepropionase, partial [Tateyamaria sp.]|nr:imidazolonepropionase [Tateyamaria sp.]